jgi:hypothetical protein
MGVLSNFVEPDPGMPLGFIPIAVWDIIDVALCGSSGEASSRFFNMCSRCFFTMRTIPSFVNGFANTSFIPVKYHVSLVSWLVKWVLSNRIVQLTPGEISVDILATNIRGHGDDGNLRVHSSDECRCGDTIHRGHDDIHENKIKLQC